MSKKIFTAFFGNIGAVDTRSDVDFRRFATSSELPLLHCNFPGRIFILFLCFPFVSSFRYRDPCSLSLNEDDNHTITLVGNANKRAVTLAKTCEQVNELRDCRAPRDWSILALQNTRTGKSHYLVICKCPSHFRLGELSPRWFSASLTGPINIENRETISLL